MNVSRKFKKFKKNKWVMNNYAEKKFDALMLIQSILTQEEFNDLYNRIIRSARTTNNDYITTDSQYISNYTTAKAIRKNFPQITGIVPFLYRRYRCLPSRFRRMRRTRDGGSTISIEKFLSLFKY